jgi:hypothetical protein
MYESRVADLEIDAIDYLKGMVDRKPDANVNTMRDLVASKFKSSFGGNYERAKEWASQFVFDHISPSTGKVTESVEVKKSDWGFAGAVIRDVPEEVNPEDIAYYVNYETQEPKYDKLFSKMDDARVDCVRKGTRIELKFTMEVYKIMKKGGPQAKALMKAYQEILTKVLKELTDSKSDKE